ncbi:oligosaccharide flippase family protein [Hoeflea sp.]|uniref:oligosaccharide flippase family protein n=1 Tax=Hoeflea sp. TaxID=1940281 RepID=UPI0019B73279|nr:oligosaccharide flippase family protein [Hoeflea sp.]MBC7284754.1 oligosaccharide flippase family protein [Hoeflea sp.]
MAHLNKWIGASAGDVGVRLGAQMISTIILARLLPADDFGVSLLVLSVVAVLGNLVSLPFEEALTQRPRLSTPHLESALFVSFLLSLVSLFVLWAVSPLLARLTGIDSLTVWIPVAALFLAGQGPGAVARAVLRRHRRFVDLASSQALSVVLSSAVAIGLAFGGWGILALVVQRMMPIVLFPVLAACIARVRGQTVFIWPRWHAQKFGEILRFSWFYLADVTVDYATPAALTFAVNAYFGTVAVGQINIAMRMVEPLRSAIAGVGHNLVFSLLTRHQADPARLGREAASIVVNVSTVAVPAFLGLAATAPLLLPILVGPGWDSAVPISRSLCVAAAISVPFRYFYSGFSALGRPEYSLAGSILGLVVMLVWLHICAIMGQPSWIGWSIAASEAVTALLGGTLLVRYIGAGLAIPLFRIGLIWVGGGLMVAALDFVFLQAKVIEQRSLALTAMIIAGIMMYPLLLMVLCRHCLQTLLATVIPRREGP